jgi:N-acetylmuramoyl-L-alanine amidase
MINFMPAKNKTSDLLFGIGKKWQPERKFLLLVIHWIVGTAEAGIRWFQAPNNNQSSAHYIVSEMGEIIQMVEEKDVAWHAGKSKWKDYPTYGLWNSLNPCSIGIELAGPPSRIGRNSWPECEIQKCVDLCKDIKIRHPEIKLIDHSRICSTKIDVIKGTGFPEDVFPWEKLVRESGIEEA